MKKIKVIILSLSCFFSLNYIAKATDQNNLNEKIEQTENKKVPNFEKSTNKYEFYYFFKKKPYKTLRKILNKYYCENNTEKNKENDENKKINNISDDLGEIYETLINLICSTNAKKPLELKFYYDRILPERSQKEIFQIYVFDINKIYDKYTKILDMTKKLKNDINENNIKNRKLCENKILKEFEKLKQCLNNFLDELKNASDDYKKYHTKDSTSFYKQKKRYAFFKTIPYKFLFNFTLPLITPICDGKILNQLIIGDDKKGYRSDYLRKIQEILLDLVETKEFYDIKQRIDYTNNLPEEEKINILKIPLSEEKAIYERYLKAYHEVCLLNNIIEKDNTLNENLILYNLDLLVRDLQNLLYDLDTTRMDFYNKKLFIKKKYFEKHPKNPDVFSNKLKSYASYLNDEDNKIKDRLLEYGEKIDKNKDCSKLKEKRCESIDINGEEDKNNESKNNLKVEAAKHTKLNIKKNALTLKAIKRAKLVTNKKKKNINDKNKYSLNFKAEKPAEFITRKNEKYKNGKNEYVLTHKIKKPEKLITKKNEKNKNENIEKTSNDNKNFKPIKSTKLENEKKPATQQPLLKSLIVCSLEKKLNDNIEKTSNDNKNFKPIKSTKLENEKKPATQQPLLKSLIVCSLEKKLNDNIKQINPKDE